MLQGQIWPVGFHNVAELLPIGPGVNRNRAREYHLCRVPQSVRVELNDMAYARALEATSCEIRFNLVGAQAEVVLRMEDKPALVEVGNVRILL